MHTAVYGMTDGQFKAYVKSLLAVLEQEGDAEKAREKLVELLRAALED